MRRRVLLCLTLISVSACNGDKIGQPISSPISPPSRSISDGTFALGNPDFFFLPPMVKNPSSSPNWTPGGFNGTLHPKVHVCQMTGTTEATATLTSICSDLATNVSLTDEQYYVNWQVPTSSTVFYRLSVVVGTKVLGWADVETASNASQLKNVTTGEYVPLVDGRTLPVKFRIERYALCDVPGTGPCASSTVDLSSGGSVSTTVVADGLPAGITIPAGAGTTSTTITVQTCPDLPLDSPLFGSCVRVTADPALPPSGFAVAATVFICDVNDASVASRVVDHAQSERITIHRLDPGVEGSVITALPHAPACGEPIASTEGSMRGMLAALRRGSVGAAAREVLSMLAPKPLYAARYIDLGGGGFTSELSDFQFALPSTMSIEPPAPNMITPGGAVLNPTIKVTDLAGEVVRGATVHFATEAPSAGGDVAVTTNELGLASTSWTIVPGTNVLSARGRGIAAANSNGPRRSPGGEIDDIADPFQPIQSPFDVGAPSPAVPVPVLTGIVTFTTRTPADLLGSSAGRGLNVSDPNPGSLFAIDPSTGAATLLGSTGVAGGDQEPEVSALAVDPTTGTLYGMVGSACTGAQLIVINRFTGAGSAAHTLSGAGFDGTPHLRSECTAGVDGLAFASDGTLYASAWTEADRSGHLLKVDKNTGAVLAVLSTRSEYHLSGLAFSASGALWASRGGSGRGQIVQINPADGSTIATVVLQNSQGGLESTLTVSDLAFSATGVLYASLPAENRLATIDLATGVVSRIVGSGFGSILTRMSGLTFY